MIRWISVFAIILLATIIITPQASSEELENHIILSSEEIQKPKAATGVEKLTVTGIISDYERGDIIDITIISSTNEIKEFSTFGSEKGKFFTIINIDGNYTSGEYLINVIYQDKTLSSSSRII